VELLADEPPAEQHAQPVPRGPLRTDVQSARPVAVCAGRLGQELRLLQGPQGGRPDEAATTIVVGHAASRPPPPTPPQRPPHAQPEPRGVAAQWPEVLPAPPHAPGPQGSQGGLPPAPPPHEGAQCRRVGVHPPQVHLPPQRGAQHRGRAAPDGGGGGGDGGGARADGAARVLPGDARLLRRAALPAPAAAAARAARHRGPDREEAVPAAAHHRQLCADAAHGDAAHQEQIIEQMLLASSDIG